MLKHLLRAVFSHKGKGAVAYPADGHNAFTRGQRAMEQGDLDLAEVLLRDALEIDPDSAQAQFALGRVLHGKGRLRDAARCLVRAQNLAPDDAKLGKSLYVLFEDLSERGDSKGQTQTDNDLDFIDFYARAHDRMIDGDFAAAEQSLLSSHELHTGWPFTHQRLGCLAALRGATVAADAWFARSSACGLLPDINIRLDPVFLNSLKEPETTLGKLQRIPANTGAESASLVIFVSGDPAYFRRFAHALLGSAIEHGNTHLVWHFHLINPDTWIEDEFAELSSRHPQYSFCLSSETRQFASVEEAKVYFSCARFLVFPEVLRSYALPVLLLDLDLLILGSLGSLVQSLSTSDVALVRWGGDRWKIWDQYWASAVLANSNERAKIFFGRVAAYVQHFMLRGKGTWYLDQIALYAIASNNETSLQPADIALIPTEYCAVNHVTGLADVKGVVLWSVTYNIEANASALLSDLYRRYLPRTKRLFGWTMPGFDLVFQIYLAGANTYNGRKSWDTTIKDFCLSRMSRRRHAVDVGGHVGFWSYWLADCFDCVDAFEPDPLLQECFRDNVRQQNVILHACALGRERGSVRLQADASNSGMTHVAPDQEGTVPMLPLDSMNWDDIDFIKLDAEGFELFVLQGAIETLKRNRPLILIEQDDRWGTRYGQSAAQGLALLKDIGARVIAEMPEHNFLLGWPD